MKAIIQRVKKASVTVDDKVISQIDHGILILLGVAKDDTMEHVEWLCNKIVNLRIFNDANNKMNLSLKNVNGDAIVVSQFTLFANTQKGTRPSYIDAAKPDIAIPLYEKFVTVFQEKLGKKIGTGIFGINMQITLVNDGPVTISLERK